MFSVHYIIVTYATVLIYLHSYHAQIGVKSYLHQHLLLRENYRTKYLPRVIVVIFHFNKHLFLLPSQKYMTRHNAILLSIWRRLIIFKYMKGWGEKVFHSIIHLLIHSSTILSHQKHKVCCSRPKLLNIFLKSQYIIRREMTRFGHPAHASPSPQTHKC